MKVFFTFFMHFQHVIRITGWLGSVYHPISTVSAVRLPCCGKGTCCLRFGCCDRWYVRWHVMWHSTTLYSCHFKIAHDTKYDRHLPRVHVSVIFMDGVGRLGSSFIWLFSSSYWWSSGSWRCRWLMRSSNGVINCYRRVPYSSISGW